jgi:hypothetical protein
MNSVNFWDVHGWVFLFFMFFFPRITTLVATAAVSMYGGVLFWLGWLLLPRLTVAIIATTIYWTHNPFLCVVAWAWAFAGETSEKRVAASKLQ